MLPILLLMLPGADPVPHFKVENKCVSGHESGPRFIVRNKAVDPAPQTPDASKPAPPGWEWVKPQGEKWQLKKINGVQGVTPSKTFPAVGQSFGGCGCAGAANCGASFCKARGGTGCPQSCPVKK